MKTQKFEDLIAWQKAQDIAVDVYTTFKEWKDWGFRDHYSSSFELLSFQSCARGLRDGTKRG